MKLIKKQWKRKINLVIITLSFISCSNSGDNSKMELKIKNSCIEFDSIYSIPLNSLTDFEWTELYIVIGPKFPVETEEIIGVKYKNLIEDNSHQYIYLLKSEIVKEFSSSSQDFGLNRITIGKGFVKFSNSSNIKVLKRKNEGLLYYEACP